MPTADVCACAVSAAARSSMNVSVRLTSSSELNGALTKPLLVILRSRMGKPLRNFATLLLTRRRGGGGRRGSLQILVVPGDVALVAVTHVARSLDAVELVGVDDELRVDA